MQHCFSFEVPVSVLLHLKSSAETINKMANPIMPITIPATRGGFSRKHTLESTPEEYEDETALILKEV
jgi:hypothetical protein